MKRPRSEPPTCAPEGTVWFGGPIDKCSVSLRVFADDLDPKEVTTLLALKPTSAERKGVRSRRVNGEVRRFPLIGHWIFELADEDCKEWDLEEVVLRLLERIPSSPDVWRTLHTRFRVDLWCDVQMEAMNRGFSLSPKVLRMLADRRLKIGFDIWGPETEAERK